MRDETPADAVPDAGGAARQHLVTFCGKCSCGCPQLFVDHDAPAERRIVLVDDFGQQVQMSVDQFYEIIDQAKSGALESVLDSALAVASGIQDAADR
ncbi:MULTISPECIES: hypothetical protein [Protofrankia]|uniref:Uncharacterized protein n=1 Tax=Candidatus Protofrankia datiscae TaxID=2716812 RepID=F8AVC7_9ACTN|nr:MULTISPECIES: hypothetical protein [Protofrankia]AEH08221.1 hypothetical protein FsymDg_0698 [Candidatus Protofrankia datiscae]